ncbi:MAG: hypothetical protein WD077_01400 [Bacteroidia bacterium]
MLKWFAVFCLLVLPLFTSAQETTIRGFAHFETLYDIEDERLNFSIGEQDLFITSDLTDRITFLGESVFKPSSTSSTGYNVSIERIIIKYNIKGNHNLLFGKHHTPLSYWNDTYHHGRVFFPTINRPQLFSDQIFDLHTTGMSIQGLNLGKYRFGYELMLGNGRSGGDISDDNLAKSVTARIQMKPADPTTIGISGYYDHISPTEGGGHSHGSGQLGDSLALDEMIYSFYLAHFAKKFEFLAEASYAINDYARFDASNTVAMYAYSGYVLDNKWVPYVRVDYIAYQDDKERYYNANDKLGLTAGLRYEFNFLAVAKLEYSYLETETAGSYNQINFQFAIGF